MKAQPESVFNIRRIFKLTLRVKRAITSHWKNLMFAILPYWNSVQVDYRWRFQSGGRPHRLSAPLIVSLTSYPARYSILSYTLRSLLRQTVKADRTILWVAHADVCSLPRDVTKLQSSGLEIRATHDLKSYKKIIPTLDAFPDAFICTADDDGYYWPTWLEELVDGADVPGRIVTCHRAHEITRDAQGAFKPYKQWVLETPIRGHQKSLFPTGCAGVVYPPGILAHKPEDRQAIFDLCLYGDDIWLYWIGRRNGANYKLASRRHDFITWPGSQAEGQGLWRYNFLQDGNDEQIRKMAERYGYPSL